MIDLRHATLSLALAITVLALGPAASPVQAAQEGRRLVSLRIVLPSGETIHASAIEGEALRLRHQGRAVHLRPFVQPGNELQVALQVLEPVEVNGRQVGENLLTGLLLTPHTSSLVLVDRLSIDVELVGVKEPALESRILAPGGSDESDLMPRECCVSCGDTSACGCQVEMSCGSCCVRICCNLGPFRS